MQSKQNSDAKDHCCEQNLYDVIVENLLIRVGGVEEIGVFLVGGVVRKDWINVRKNSFF
jgi:hypothetical protein